MIVILLPREGNLVNTIYAWIIEKAVLYVILYYYYYSILYYIYKYTFVYIYIYIYFFNK